MKKFLGIFIMLASLGLASATASQLSFALAALPTPLPGKIKKTPTPLAASTCNYAQWKKVFEGESQTVVDSNQIPLQIRLALAHSQIRKILKDGCDFKAVFEIPQNSFTSASIDSYQCAQTTAAVDHNDSQFFFCYPSLNDGGGGNNSPRNGFNLKFESGGGVNYLPYDAPPSFPFILSLFVKG